MSSGTPSEIVTPFGGSVGLTNAVNQTFRAFNIILSGVPYDPCIRVAAQDFGSAMSNRWINNNGTTAGAPMTVSQAQKRCTPGATNTLQLQFRF